MVSEGSGQARSSVARISRLADSAPSLLTTRSGPRRLGQNVFVVKDGELLTPPINGSNLQVHRRRHHLPPLQYPAPL